MGREMDDNQWNELEKKFDKLDIKIEDIKKGQNELHVGMVVLGNEIGVKVFGDEIGKSTGNGLISKVKENSIEIKNLKDKPKNTLKTWVTIIAGLFVIASGLYVAISESIKKDIQSHQSQQHINPGPTQ